MTAILLLCALLASFATWIAAAMLFLAGRRDRAAHVLVRWTACAAAYLAIVLVTAAALPSGRNLSAAGPHCDDDWCMSVDRLVRSSSATGAVSYRLEVRVFSQAHSGERTAKGAWLYVSDQQGRRFRLTSDPARPPLDVALRPGQTVATTLTFTVPADARELYFNGGLAGIRYASFIIGNGDLLRKPRLRFRIQ